jgi:iron complex transport system substrate-binding protein
VIEWPDPLFAAGHWVPDLVRRAGGQDALAMAGTHSTTVTAAQVAESDPDVLVVAPCGYDVSRAAAAARTLLATSSWQWAHARPVWAIDANTLTSRPGPHLVRGVEVLAAALHPTLFPSVPDEEAVQIQ